MSDPLLTFEENGFPVELASDRDIGKAVKAGRLRADTVVTIYESQGAITRSRASEVPRLQPYFRRSEPEPAAEPAAEGSAEEPASAAPSQEEGEEAVAVAAPAAAAAPPPSRPEDSLGWGAEPASDSRADRSDDVRAPEFPPQMSRLPAIIVGGLLVLGLLIIAGSLSQQGRVPSPPIDIGGGSNATDLGTEPEALPPEEVVGEPRSFFAVREVVVRSRSTTAAPEVTRLARGEALFGTPVRVRESGEEWLRLDRGPYSGSYVWRRNLSEDPRPELLYAQDEARTVRADTTVHDRPDFSSTALQTLTAGTEVRLVGAVRDGWWEISLRSGGVGYIGPAALAETPEPGSSARGIVLRNDCRYSIDVRLVYQSSFGWADSDGNYWRVAPGDTIRIMHNSRLVEAYAPEIYYHITSRAGTWSSSDTRYFTHGGRQLLMNRANYQLDPNGNYLISFSCN